ncbi:TMEM165/GDT1 family protein [Haladaptatus pallidirubidus]|uniref:TMEM165/GDT1 family protein n=1 Tax=Haladaptatus pallidirubidus TaxID=1008152 RepID=A0AAV3UCQ7_9EURY|nr:TMEM165/GDT1 family protein [Haladaptatus pallidirubidus]
MAGTAFPLTTGFQAIIHRYNEYGPLLASFLANMLATFGDKGQLVVVTLASRYDVKTVFAGAMAAFSLWSLIEVVFGQWIVTVLPGGLITTFAGYLFVVFGLWTFRSAFGKFRAESNKAPAMTEGGLDVGVSGRFLPDSLLARMGAYGGVLTSFVFIMVAEFGDKTQLLTIDLAATFPDAPLSVFAGVVTALGLRTGVDALIGERFERWVPTKWIEFGAAVVFVLFGTFVLAG